MNMPGHSVLLLVLAAMPGHAQTMEPATTQPGTAANATYTERISDEALLERQKVKPIAKTVPPETDRRPYDIVAMSDFIAFDELSTLVPKGAILHIPEGFRHNVVQGPKGQLLLWNEFLTRNRARVAPLEIGVEEATGAKPIDPKTLAAAMRNGMILVAVIHGNPSSVAPPVSPPPATVPR